jgi:thioredoxin reductase (NADPH)
MTENEYEVLVVGGGPAGLSAALYLARYDRKTALFDASDGRSSWHQTNYNLVGFLNGIKAQELCALGRKQLAEYPHVELHDGCKIDTITRNGEWFIARNEGGEWRSRAVILCTGVKDFWPEFPGWQEYVGRSMFWCITCDGYTCRDQRMVVVGNTDMAASTTLQLQRFSHEITLITNSDENHITPLRQERLQRAGIALVHDRIVSATGSGGYFEALHTAGGLTIPLDCLFNQQGSAPRTKLARQLGVALTDDGYIITDNEQKTNVPGVFAAGDLDRLHSHQVTTALHEGGQAASAANYYLYPPTLKDPES